MEGRRPTRPYRIVLLSTLLALTGCIPRSRTLVLLPSKPAPRDPIQGVTHPALEVQVADTRTQVVDQPLENRLQVGFSRGMAGEPTFPYFYAAEPIQETFAKLLKEELAARGCVVVASSPLCVRLEIQRFQLNFKGALNARWVGELTTAIVVTRGQGQPEYARTIATETEAVHGDLWPLWEDPLREGARTLCRGMAEAMGLLFKDEHFLSCLVDREPVPAKPASAEAPTHR